MTPEQRTSPVERIGRDVAEQLGDGPSSARIAAQRIALVQKMEARRRPAAGLPWRFAFAGVALGVALLGAARFVGDVSFGFGESGIGVAAGTEALEEGSWVRTGGNEERELRYTEGTLVRVEPNSRVRVSKLGKDSSRVSLESGALHSQVVPKTGVKWVFEAGPHEVVVVGTEFVLGWDGSSEKLSLSVVHGLVEVHSTGKNAVIPVAGGQRLSMDARGHQLVEERAPEVTEAPEDVPGAVEELPPAELEPAPVAPRSATLPGRTVRPGASAAPTSATEWKELLLAHEYAAAVEAAERVGFDDLVASVSATDLLKLGDAARLTGNAGRARQALLGVTQRFVGSSAAALAAYSLGRLAVDVQRDDREAVKWFRTYLTSGAGGEVAAGARARLMDALLRLGDEPGARAVARDYLRYHPNGRHANVAGSLLRRAAE